MKGVAALGVHIAGHHQERVMELSERGCKREGSCPRCSGGGLPALPSHLPLELLCSPGSENQDSSMASRTSWVLRPVHHITLGLWFLKEVCGVSDILEEFLL